MGNGTQVGFLAASDQVVGAAQRTALTTGTLLGKPSGLRIQYAADFYAAYCLDPAGHKLYLVHTKECSA